MTCKLRITFVLPPASPVPGGGFKVVYEYANHLSRKGHKVVVVHPVTKSACETHMLDNVKNGIHLLQLAIGKHSRPDRWFPLDPHVSLLFVPSLSEKWIPEGDVVIATGWRTAQWVSRYRAAKGMGFYLIQGLEIWEGPEEEVYATWKLPLKKLVIARWLEDVAKSQGEDAVYIPNGMSADEFQMDVAPEERDPKRIMMLYHEAQWKGTRDGLAALLMVREKVPDIKVALFGVPRRPASLPEWIGYFRQPDRHLLRTLYNKAAIFVAPSWTEGWSLPASEALLCGTALVATDEGGHREYAFHEETALLSPVKDQRGLANNILRLASDTALRIRMARRGHEYIQQFTWERASDHLESILCGPCESKEPNLYACQDP
jgi:glycosyltransferase involved in cell wall biosynthesis